MSRAEEDRRAEGYSERADQVWSRAKRSAEQAVLDVIAVTVFEAAAEGGAFVLTPARLQRTAPRLWTAIIERMDPRAEDGDAEWACRECRASNAVPQQTCHACGGTWGMTAAERADAERDPKEPE